MTRTCALSASHIHTFLHALASRDDWRDRKRGQAVAHQHIELENEDVVQQALDHKEDGAPVGQPGPTLVSFRCRLALDLHADAEHDGEQSQELAVRDQRACGIEQRVGGLCCSSIRGSGANLIPEREVRIEILLHDAVHLVPGGKDPDIRRQCAQNCDAASHVESDDSPIGGFIHGCHTRQNAIMRNGAKTVGLSLAVVEVHIYAYVNRLHLRR